MQAAFISRSGASSWWVSERSRSMQIRPGRAFPETQLQLTRRSRVNHPPVVQAHLEQPQLARHRLQGGGAGLHSVHQPSLNLRIHPAHDRPPRSSTQLTSSALNSG